MEKIFKAKRLDNGEWFEFDLKDLLGPYNECLSFIMDKDTICQYTGINDIEGNSIFEGDQLDFDPVEWGGAHKFFIEWNDKNACFDGDGVPSDWPEWCILTGHNIHDKD